MKDRGKTKKQLVDELVELRERMAALESLESEYLRTGDALRQRTADLLASHKKLDTFARALSSDLREPLGLVVSFAQMLEKDYAALSGEELHHYLQELPREDERSLMSLMGCSRYRPGRPKRSRRRLVHWTWPAL